MNGNFAALRPPSSTGSGGAEGVGLVARVEQLFSQVLAIDVPSVDSDLIESGLLNSLAIVELLVNIEDSFGVEIPLEELELDHFRSVRSIAALVKAQGEGGGEGAA